MLATTYMYALRRVRGERGELSQKLVFLYFLSSQSSWKFGQGVIGKIHHLATHHQNLKKKSLQFNFLWRFEKNAFFETTIPIGGVGCHTPYIFTVDVASVVSGTFLIFWGIMVTLDWFLSRVVWQELHLRRSSLFSFRFRFSATDQTSPATQSFFFFFSLSLHSIDANYE